MINTDTQNLVLNRYCMQQGTFFRSDIIITFALFANGSYLVLNQFRVDWWVILRFTSLFTKEVIYTILPLYAIPETKQINLKNFTFTLKKVLFHVTSCKSNTCETLNLSLRFKKYFSTIVLSSIMTLNSSTVLLFYGCCFKSRFFWYFIIFRPKRNIVVFLVFCHKKLVLVRFKKK